MPMQVLEQRNGDHPWRVLDTTTSCEYIVEAVIAEGYYRVTRVDGKEYARGSSIADRVIAAIQRTGVPIIK